MKLSEIAEYIVDNYPESNIAYKTFNLSYKRMAWW